MDRRLSSNRLMIVLHFFLRLQSSWAFSSGGAITAPPARWALARTRTQAKSDGVESSPVIQWYPGHIAKAERQLIDCLKRVDVVVELRDARIPAATAHPLVAEWVGPSIPRIVVFSREDMAPREAIDEWRRHLSTAPVEDGGVGGAPLFFVDSRTGKGARDVKRAILAAGAHVNTRRERRGIRPRAVRAVIIGFPNVGKSALINQLIGRKRAVSEDRPGVTKTLQWVRLGGKEASEIELLDSPGIIPAKQVDQRSALKLAICNDIGEASYDTERVAAALLELLREVNLAAPSYADLAGLGARYGVDPGAGSGEDLLLALADAHHHGDGFAAARRLLADLRKGHLGRLALDLPPSVKAEGEAEAAHQPPGGPRPTGEATQSSQAAALNPQLAVYSSKADPAASGSAPADQTASAAPYWVPAAPAPGLPGAAPIPKGAEAESGGGVEEDKDTAAAPPPIEIAIPDMGQLGASSFEGW